MSFGLGTNRWADARLQQSEFAESEEARGHANNSSLAIEATQLVESEAWGTPEEGDLRLAKGSRSSIAADTAIEKQSWA